MESRIAGCIVPVSDIETVSQGFDPAQRSEAGGGRCGEVSGCFHSHHGSHRIGGRRHVNLGRSESPHFLLAVVRSFYFDK